MCTGRRDMSEERQLIFHVHRMDTVVPFVHTEPRRWELGRTSCQARGPPINLMPPSPSLIIPSVTEFYLDLLNVSLISNYCLCGSLFHNGSNSVSSGWFVFLSWCFLHCFTELSFQNPSLTIAFTLSERLQWCLTVCRKRTASGRLLPCQAGSPSLRPLSKPLLFVVLSRRAFRAGVLCLSVLLLPSVSVCTWIVQLIYLLSGWSVSINS